ncbi:MULTISPECIES: MFS transporter [Enterococcaceae]|uniref:MFS transporter n=1 Tax=Enterococcaceae TaxID=81852 RepID=UPI001313EDA6|nr:MULTISPECIES: MFS transporter [Enterococcaceae]UNM88844.1 MFS transporter [Vagococcus sp. CY52-2]
MKKKVEMNSFTAMAILSISFILTSGVSINGTLPFIKKSLELTQVKAELLSTIPSITVIIFILLSSSISKKIGMKKTVVIGLLLVCLGGVLPKFISNNYLMIFLGRLLLGAGFGMYNALSVSFINGLYSGRKRSELLGIRNAIEGLGQMVLTFVAGLLITINWTNAYLIYFLSLPIALFFYHYVPEVEIQTDRKKNPFSLSKPLVFTAIFASSLVMNSIAVAVRFPSLAIELKGETINTSLFLSIMPALGIIAGFLFERVIRLFHFKVIYVALGINILFNLFVYLSDYSFILLLIGLFISSVPVAWILPYIFNHIEQIAKGVDINQSTSVIFIGCNLGVLLSPVMMSLLNGLFHTTDLKFPFLCFVVFYLIVLLVIRLNHDKIEKFMN